MLHSLAHNNFTLVKKRLGMVIYFFVRDSYGIFSNARAFFFSRALSFVPFENMHLNEASRDPPKLKPRIHILSSDRLHSKNSHQLAVERFRLSA